MNEELEKAYDELEDLEFDFNLINKFADTPDREVELRLAESRIRRQIKKIRKLEESISNENNTGEVCVEAQEE